MGLDRQVEVSENHISRANVIFRLSYEERQQKQNEHPNAPRLRDAR